MQEPLDLHVDERGVAALTLNRPKRANAFDAALADALLLAVERCAGERNLRLLIVQGNPRVFCAGIDIAWMKESGGATYDDNLRDARKMARILHGLRTMPVPVLAIVSGAAIGLGVGLAAACDIAIGAETAKFRLSEVRLGIIPSVISPYMIDAIGERACRRYFLTAEEFSAQEALRLGLLHAVAAATDLPALADRLTGELLAGKPLAQHAAKDAIEHQRSPAISEALIEETAKRLASVRRGAEAQDALAAFLKA